MARIAMMFLALGLIGTAAQAQALRKDGRTSASPSYRTLTGKITDVKASDQMVTVEIPGGGASKSSARGQSWVLSVGKQTLLLRAGRNGQFTTIELGDLHKGETVQGVVELEADPSDKSHTGWWLVVYPAGTKPTPR